MGTPRHRCLVLWPVRTPLPLLQILRPRNKGNANLRLLRTVPNAQYLAMAEALEVHREEEALFGRDWYDPDCFAIAILDAKYEKVNVDDVVKQLTHLSKS